MTCELKEGETLDVLSCGELKIIQHQQGYRFSVDPVLLGHFAQIKAGDRIVDLGCGSGVIAMLLARRNPEVSVLGMELQLEQSQRARRSAELNGLSDQVEIVHGDVRQIDHALHGRFDRVVSNPPFRPLETGRCSSGDERANARHEFAGGLDEFVGSGALLLRHGGTLSMIHLAERVVDIFVAMRGVKLEPKRVRYIHSRCGSEARLVMVEARKGGRPGLHTEPPLFVYRATSVLQSARGRRDRYSAEVEAIYAN